MDSRTLLLPLALTGAMITAGCADQGPAQKPLQGQVHFTLIHTSDIHSRLYPYNLQLGQVDAGLGLGAANEIVNVGGAARVSHIVGRERARATRVLHLDGGDCFQGAPIFNFFSGEAEVRAMSSMGTDAMIVANHEFDRGALNLGLQLQKWASFPVMAANYKLEDPSQPGASPLGSILVPYTVFDLDGLKVGAVGMGNLSSLTSIFDSPNRLGITPLNTTEVAQFYIDTLRPLVDVVVFVTHLGLDVDERMIESTSGIDVVLGGHNHIVLQPPKRVRDCSKYSETDSKGNVKHFIALDGPEGAEDGLVCCEDSECASGFCLRSAGTDAKECKADATRHGVCKVKRYCEPRDVILAHSGAFAKYVGRLDLIVSNDKKDLADRKYDPLDGFEVLTHDYHLFPVNESIPEDPIVSSVLEPYHQSLDALGNLELLVGYALDGSKRNSTSGGDSPLGNMISTAMWLRLGIQTDFALTNTTGIRADLVPGPVTVEQMFNIFPFDNSITKMQLSGVEVQELFDFVARRSAGRGCVSQAQIAGARIVIDCTKVGVSPDPSFTLPPGVATNIYIGTTNPVVKCQSDGQCPGKGVGSCDVEAGVCWQAIEPIASYELATSNYLAAGGSGFRVLQRNTTQNDTKVQQRDALVDYIRAGAPCGADADGKLKTCSRDSDCGSVGEGYVCACPETVVEGAVCTTDATKKCSAGTGACVLGKCRDDVATFQRATCKDAPSDVKKECIDSIQPCVSAAGEQCKFLACVDRRLGNFSDGRLRMVGQLKTSLIASSAGLAALLALTSGCDGGPGQGIVEPSTFAVSVTAVNGGALPTYDKPLPANRGDTIDTWDFTIEARKSTGELEPFNGVVRLTVQPGAVLTIAGDDTFGRNVRLKNGKAKGSVDVTAIYGPTRLWVEDIGYLPAEPGKTPACSNGKNDDPEEDTLIDYPADPGCAFADDDTETGGTYAAGVSDPVAYSLPKISDVQGDGTATPYPFEAIEIATDAPQRLIVTRVASDGFYVTDISPAEVANGYNHLYAFNFSTPPGMQVCDHLTYLTGTANEFFGFTELSFPSYELDFPIQGEDCEVPEPAIIDAMVLADPVAMEKIESALVRVEDFHVAAHFGPEFGKNNVFGENKSNCDFNSDGQIDFSTDNDESRCSNACDADPECSEWTGFSARGAYKVSSGATMIKIQTGSIPGFDPTGHRGEVLTVTGTLREFSGGTLNWTIETRCEDDLACDDGCSTKVPISSKTACVRLRTIDDNDQGTN